ncbi:hypothetical protein FJY63_15285, partial [Candidatus Sumerlaeota bacterium]|nr:hypothetical protein [Candidatus Sumerlaeota bacterium]
MTYSEAVVLGLAVSLGGVQFQAFHGYLFAFAIGSIYALISAILSGALGGDFGDHHVDVATDHHVDVGGAGGEGMVHFSPLSPMIIATFMTAFGGTGIICTKVFQMRGYTSLPVSIVCALGVAAAVFAMFEWIFEKTQASVNIEPQ